MVETRRPAGLAGVTSFRSDGRRLATTGPNGDLKLWDTTTPRHPALLMRLTDRYRVTAAAWNPTAADLLATLSTDGNISIWRMVDDRPPDEVLNLPLPYGRSGHLAWLSAGRHIACVSCDGTLSVWDIGSGSRRTETFSDATACLALASGTDDVLRAAYEDGSVRRMLPLKDSGRMRTRRIPPITAAAWSATGHRLAVTPGTGLLEIRDDALQIQWSKGMTTAGTLIFAWHGDSEIVVADRAARQVVALDTDGGTLWEAKLATEPTSLSAANGVVAVGGCHFRPQIIDIKRGTPLHAS
jgi:WD40 repeat protein